MCSGVKYNCDLCEYKATHKGHLKEHVNSVHFKSNLFSYSVCDKKISYKNHRDSHFTSVNIKERHKCNQWDFESTTKSNLRGHVERIHTIRINKYPCDATFVINW